MPDRFVRIALGLALGLLTALVAQPYILAFLYSAETPRAVTARGDLSAAERSTVELFARPPLRSSTSSRRARRGAVP